MSDSLFKTHPTCTKISCFKMKKKHMNQPTNKLMNEQKTNKQTNTQTNKLSNILINIHKDINIKNPQKNTTEDQKTLSESTIIGLLKCIARCVHDKNKRSRLDS